MKSVRSPRCWYAILPIRAITRRRIDIASHPTPARVTPIRLRAGALGHQTPSQDLLLPQEALLSIPSDSTSVLTPIGALVNGISILREPAAGIVTWHSIELDEHDILRAENAPIGSLRGLRTSEPSRTPPRAPLCQPFMPPGAAMLTLRTQLHKRATSPEFMALITGTQPELWIANDPAHPLRLFADGKEVAADEGGSDTQFRFTLPANTGPVRLHATPHDSPSPKDLRRLGVCVVAMELDGAPIDLSGPMPARGFHAVEGDGLKQWRWTDGQAWLALPYATTSRQLSVTITDWHRALA